MSLVYTFDHNQPKYRERTYLDEQRVKLSWVSRSLGDATLRASLEYGDRTGGSYNYDPYTQFYSESLPGYVPANGIAPTAFTVDAMRKYDMSDRKETKARVILLYPLGLASTVSATFYGNRDQYDAPLGRQNTAPPDSPASTRHCRRNRRGRPTPPRAARSCTSPAIRHRASRRARRATA